MCQKVPHRQIGLPIRDPLLEHVHKHLKNKQKMWRTTEERRVFWLRLGEQVAENLHSSTAGCLYPCPSLRVEAEVTHYRN